MTLRELVYMVIDELKLLSDDSTFNEEHIKFLLNKHRVAILYQLYNKQNTRVAESNYQYITLPLERLEDSSIFGLEREYMISEIEVPNLLKIGDTKVNLVDSKFNYRSVLIDSNRLDYVGFNKWTKNIVYYAIRDKHLYMYSYNEEIQTTYEVILKGVFEDVEGVFKLNNPNSNVLDMDYPLESNLVPLVIQSVVQELAPKTITPEDSLNNASDDKANLNNFIRRNLKQNPQ